VRLRRLTRAELPAGTAALARFLIGKLLVSEHPEGGIAGDRTSGGRTSGRIVETEAYPPGDAAGHAFRGPTPRHQALYLERGHAYVYLAYGTSWMCNVSSEASGVGAGVLLRALEPLEGIALMEARRGTTKRLDLARGPGRLAAALAIDRGLDGIDLCAPGRLWLATATSGGPGEPGPIGRSPRIGITREVDRLWRFYERGSPFVSGPRRLRE
jgi:DNA-3-methyladenine glycosylase